MTTVTIAIMARAISSACENSTSCSPIFSSIHLISEFVRLLLFRSVSPRQKTRVTFILPKEIEFARVHLSCKLINSFYACFCSAFVKTTKRTVSF